MCVFCAYEAETNKKLNGQRQEMVDGRIPEALGGGTEVEVQFARLALGPRSPLTRFMWFMARSKASRTAFRT